MSNWWAWAGLGFLILEYLGSTKLPMDGSPTWEQRKAAYIQDPLRIILFIICVWGLTR